MADTEEFLDCISIINYFEFHKLKTITELTQRKEIKNKKVFTNLFKLKKYLEVKNSLPYVIRIEKYDLKYDKDEEKLRAISFFVWKNFIITASMKLVRICQMKNKKLNLFQVIEINEGEVRYVSENFISNDSRTYIITSNPYKAYLISFSELKSQFEIILSFNLPYKENTCSVFSTIQRIKSEFCLITNHTSSTTSPIIFFNEKGETKNVINVNKKI